MSSALCRKAWGTVLWYGKFGFGGRCLNKIFAGRTVLVTVHTIPPYPCAIVVPAHSSFGQIYRKFLVCYNKN